MQPVTCSRRALSRQKKARAPGSPVRAPGEADPKRVRLRFIKFGMMLSVPLRLSRERLPRRAFIQRAPDRMQERLGRVWLFHQGKAGDFVRLRDDLLGIA